MLCPKCGYALDAFEKECPRCVRMKSADAGRQSAPTTPPTAPTTHLPGHGAGAKDANTVTLHIDAQLNTPATAKRVIQAVCVLAAAAFAFYIWNNTGSRLAYRLYDEGVQLAGDGKWEFAENKFKAAIDADPNLDVAHLNRGLCYLKLGQWIAAEEEIREGIELIESGSFSPTEGRQKKNEALSIAHSNLGEIALQRTAEALLNGDYVRGETQLNKAKSEFQQAISLD